MPADWLAANNNNLPNAPGCPEPNGGLTAHDPVMLELKVRAPTNAKSFSYRFNFFSAEYPEFLCQDFNDFFVALIALGYAASFAMADKWVALTLLTLTTSIPLIRGVLGSAQGKDLIPFLAKTGQLQLRYALLLAIALQLSHG